MNNSQMVVADKYQLDKAVSLTEGTWDKKGPKTKIHRKIVPRDYVEMRNSQDNNELYVIDEDATKEMIKMKAEKLVKKQERAAKENLSQADLIDMVAGKNTAQIEPPVEPTVEALRLLCDEKGIEYSKQAGVTKLTALLEGK